jgi:hypothetical protein
MTFAALVNAFVSGIGFAAGAIAFELMREHLAKRKH